MITFTFDENVCRVEGHDTEASRIIAEATSSTYSVYFKKRKMRWPEKRQVTECLFKIDDSMPTGILPRVMEYLDKAGIDYKIVDRRKKVIRGHYDTDIVLFDDQAEAVAPVLTGKRSRGYFDIPTGGGKTVIAAKIISELGLPTLYVVPSRTLLDQTYGDLKGFLKVKVGRIGDGLFEQGEVIVATVQSLYLGLCEGRDSVFRLLNRVGVLILDEVHHVSSKGQRSWFRVAQHCNAYYKFGFSGSPDKRREIDLLYLIGATGSLIYKSSTDYLVENDRLTAAHIIMVGINHSPRYSDYGVAFDTHIVNGVARNRKIAEIAEYFASRGKRVLITVTRKAHGRNLEALMRDKSRFIWGEVETEDRRQALKDLTEGKYKILIGTVFSEGTNLPFLDVCINAAAGESAVNTLQRLGRVLRKHPDKDVAYLVDFIDDDSDISPRTNRLRPGVLLRHSMSRDEVYRQNKSFKYSFINSSDKLSILDS